MKKNHHRMFLQFLFVFLNLIQPSVSAQSLSPTDSFRNGVASYEQGDYAQALTHFQNTLVADHDESTLYYNLGLTHYRLGNIGQAIFNLRLAHELRPRDADIAFNLKFVRSKASDQIDPTSLTALATISAAFPLSWRETTYLLILTLSLGMLAAIIGLFRSYSWLPSLFRLAMFLFLSELALLGVRWHAQKPFGVITSDTAEVFSGQGSGSVHLFSIHAGTEFTVIANDRQWVRIMLADGKQGWVKDQQVQVNQPLS